MAQSAAPHYQNPRSSTEARLLATLERLLAIDALEMRVALEQASDLLVSALRSEKIDVFLYDQSSDTLVAHGTSNTPMGAKQKALGLDRLPVSNGGRTVEVYLTGKPYSNGKTDEDEGVIKGIREALGVRSMMVAPLAIAGSVQGVLSVCSDRRENYTGDDLNFLLAVSNWVGAIAHRAQLAEQLRQHAVNETRRATAEQLVTVLAHDLGNRLTPAVGRIDIIRRNAKRDGNEQYLKAANAARKALEQLNDLINDLLDVSRLERGLFSLTFSRFNLSPLVRDVAEGLKASGANIDIGIPEEVWVEGDEARIRQVIENLLTNAVKHGPRGVPVYIDAAREDGPEQSMIVVTVRDEGPGIEPDLIPRLFTPFSAGSRSTGLGIGLFLAHQIARAHGGSLEVEASPGSGTSFCLRLPTTRELANEG